MGASTAQGHSRCNLSSVQGWVGPDMGTVECDECNNRAATKVQDSARKEMSG